MRSLGCDDGALGKNSCEKRWREGRPLKEFATGENKEELIEHLQKAEKNN